MCKSVLDIEQIFERGHIMLDQGFKGVIGHQDIIRYLQNVIFTDKVSHAYLFAGEPGSGKRLLSGLFAMTLQCEKGGVDPCLECSSCKKAQTDNQPDIITVTHAKPEVITVDEIRTQVVDSVDIKPYESKYKIYIIPDAEKMNPQAQNALLKTIEEPPVYTILMLLTTNAEALLSTIVSRCAVLHLKTVSDNMIREYLMKKMQVPDYAAEIATAFAQGNIGKAEKAVRDEDFEEMTGNTLTLLKHIHDMDVASLIEVIHHITAKKQNINDYLELLTLWFRDVLMYKATRDIDKLVFKRELSVIRKEAEQSSYEGIEEILTAVDKAGIRLHANVNFDLSMEMLLLTLRENLND